MTTVNPLPLDIRKLNVSTINGLLTEGKRNLLHFYLQTLVELGITNAPSFEEAWHDYRVGSLWGLVIGWLITPPVNYGETITSANIQRTTQAILDVDPFTALKATAEAPSHA